MDKGGSKKYAGDVDVMWRGCLYTHTFFAFVHQHACVRSPTPTIPSGTVGGGRFLVIWRVRVSKSFFGGVLGSVLGVLGGAVGGGVCVWEGVNKVETKSAAT